MTRLNDAIVTLLTRLQIVRNCERQRYSFGRHGYFSKASSDKAIESALGLCDDLCGDMSRLEADQTSAERGVLKNFAERVGPICGTPGGPALREAFANIADELAHQYTIAYPPLNPTRDGKWRKLEVTVSRPAVKVRTRKRTAQHEAGKASIFN